MTSADAAIIDPPGIDETERWLREERPEAQERLWRRADAVRAENVGDEVHLRGLLEISNHCARTCAYCGISALVKETERYRMGAEEILECARQVAAFGYGTVVMQSGEDDGIGAEWLAGVVRRIKAETGLAVTLSMGERPVEDLEAWREAGADRYLLRFETSDPELYALVHPPREGRIADRIRLLEVLRSLGYEIGSGVMVGLPGQTYASLARDIRLFGEMDLDMVGVGPYIPHPATPLGSGRVVPPDAGGEQVPATELMTYKVVALTRLACPEANIPSTTALATLNKASGRELGLMRGANVVMPNVTPPQYRVKYQIYPGKACLNETAEMCQTCMRGRIESIGRTLGRGPGGRRRS